MVNRYNIFLWIRIALSVLMSLVAFAITYAFFYFATTFLLTRLDLPGQGYEAWIAGALTLVIALIGFRHGLSGAETASFLESDFFWELGSTGGGSYVQREYSAWVGAPALVISYTALAGPLQLLKAWSLHRQIIPATARMEADLTALLGEIRLAERWHEMTNYPGRERLVGYLIRMKKVEFSPRTGKLKALT